MKLRRILTAAFMATVLLLQTTAMLRADASLTVNLSSSEDPVKSGDTISVRVNFSNFPNLTRFGPIEVAFDPAYVTFSGMDKGGDMPSTFSVTSTASTSVISIAGLDQTVESQVATNATAPTVDDSGNPIAPPADPSMFSGERVTVCVLYFKVIENVKKGDAKFSLGSLGGFKNSTMSQVTATVGNSATVPVESIMSSNASLAAMTIEDVLFTPEFSPSVFQYEAHVSRSVTSIKVIASAADPTAVVTITGADNLVVGSNQVVIKVDAQDGQTALTYTITVVRDANFVPEGATIADKNGKIYTFAELPQALPLPFNFVQESRIIGENTVPVFTGSGVKSLLLYLQDGENAPELFQYFPDTAEIRKFLPGATLYQAAQLLTITKVTAGVPIPSGFAETDTTVNGITVKAFVDEEDTTLIYLTDEAGVSGFYIFDPADGSLCPYIDKDDSSTFLLPFIIASVVAVAEFFMLVFIIQQIRRRFRPSEEVRHV